MSESNTQQFFVVSPFKLRDKIVKPSAEPVQIPDSQVDELRMLGLISEQNGIAGVTVQRDSEGGQQLLLDIERQVLDAIDRRDQAERAAAEIELQAVAAIERRDEALRDAAAAEARRDAAIAELEKAENPRLVIGPNGSPIEALLGSDKFPAQVRIGDVDVALGDLVAQAAANATLDGASWNALKQSERDDAIQFEIFRRTPPPVKEEKPKTDKPKK